MEPRGLNDIPLPYEADECSHQTSTARSPIFYDRRPSLPSFLNNIRQDDIILIALIILLLLEGNDCDLLLVGILVVIFLS